MSRFFAFLLVLFLTSSCVVRKNGEEASSIKKAAATATRAREGSEDGDEGSVKTRPSNRPERKAVVRGARYVRANFVTGGPWSEPTFADSTVGDSVEGRI